MKETTEQKKERVDRLYLVLITLKEKCDNGDFKKGVESISSFVFKKGFKATAYIRAINSLNIIYKDEFFYSRWNEKIPVTKKLALTIVNKCSETQRLHDASYRAKKQNIITQKTHISKNSKNSKNSNISNLPKVGLIRRFLRWIY